MSLRIFFSLSLAFSFAGELLASEDSFGLRSTPASSFSLVPPSTRSLRPQLSLDGSHYESAHQLALLDSDQRITPLFRVPTPLRNTVSLWLRVYTEYSTEQTVLFDRKHPEVIYEVIDFRDLKKRSRNLMAYEIVRERQLKKRISLYRAAFAAIEKKKKRNPSLHEKSVGLSDVERRILTALQNAQHEHSIREWGKSFKIQTGQRDNVVRGLLAAEPYFPKMEDIFTQLDVPAELTRIPLVESSFNIKAHSKAGAQGVWQFMPASGREYMKVDPTTGIDERLSPLKATVAAARLLKRNLAIAGNWPLAITAYNHGYTGIKTLSKKERERALDGSLFALCDHSRKGSRRTLGYASSNYYAEFLALLHAEAYKDLFYGDTPLPVAPMLTFHRIHQPIRADEYARANGIPLRDFKLFNPDVKNTRALLPSGFFVILPGREGEMDELIGSINTRSGKRRYYTARAKNKRYTWVTREQ